MWKFGWTSKALCWVKNLVIKGHILCKSIPIIFSKWQTYRDREHTFGGKGLGMVAGRGLVSMTVNR